MSKPICYLCASDEGILLDIFGDAGKNFRENLETCLSVKVKQGDTGCTKICHKCAYELESCSRFLNKYRRSKDREEDTTRPRQEHCVLCSVTGNNVRLLRINGGNSPKNSLRKIERVIAKDLFEEKVADFAVCLDCRYNVDLLLDLRNIYEETLGKLRGLYENGLTTSELPKTRTRVVLRKTTYVPTPRLKKESDSEGSTASSDAMSLKRKRGRSVRGNAGTRPDTTATLQFRSCEQCETQVEYGIDMYRYHRTGLTVCKDCWLTMDPEKMSSSKRKKLAPLDSEGSTKLCAVFLKDVLTNPSKYNNIYKLEKDKHGNTTFLITDESSENEEKPSPTRTRTRAATSGLASLEVETTESRRAVKRPAVAKKTEEEAPKKTRPSTRRVNEPAPAPSLESSAPSIKQKAKNGVAEVDSPPSTRARVRRGSVEPPKVGSTSPESRAGTAGKRATAKKPPRPAKISSAKKTSSGDEKPQSHPESFPTTTQAVVETRKVKRARKISIPEQSTKRMSRRTRSNSLTDSTTTEPLATRRLGALTEESSEEPPSVVDTTARNKMSKIRPKIAKSDSELEKPYTCAICRIGCANKLVGKAHELTHEKQPEVKLRRLVVPPETDEPADETPLEDLEKESRMDNKPCTGDAELDDQNEKPNIERERARSVSPAVIENKLDPKESNDVSKLILYGKTIAKNSERDEKDDSDETEVSLALRDTSDDEPVQTEEIVKTINGDEDEDHEDANERESGTSKVDETGEKGEIEESTSATELRGIEDACPSTHEESKGAATSKADTVDSDATSLEKSDQRDIEGSRTTDKPETENDGKVQDCAVETLPPIDDECVKDVGNDILENEPDREENLKNAVSKPEVSDPADDSAKTSEEPKTQAQDDGKIDDHSVQETMEESKTESCKPGERERVTVDERESEKIEETEKESERKSEQKEQDEKIEDTRKEEKKETEEGEKENERPQGNSEEREETAMGEREEEDKGENKCQEKLDENKSERDTEEEEKKEVTEEEERMEVTVGEERMEVTEEGERKEVTVGEERMEVTEEGERKEVTEGEERKEVTEGEERKEVTEEEERKEVTEEKESKEVTEEGERKEVTEEEKRKEVTEEEVRKEITEEEERTEVTEEKERTDVTEEKARTEVTGEEERMEVTEGEDVDDNEKKKTDENEKEEKVDDKELEQNKEEEKTRDEEEKRKEERDVEKKKANGTEKENGDDKETEKQGQAEDEGTNERKGNDRTDDETEKPDERIAVVKDKPEEETANKIEEENNASEKQDAEKEVKKEAARVDASLGKEPCEERMTETQGPNDKKTESMGVASEVFREVFDLASAEVKKRLESEETFGNNSDIPETLENISLEIESSADALGSERSASNDKS